MLRRLLYFELSLPIEGDPVPAGALSESIAPAIMETKVSYSTQSEFVPPSTSTLANLLYHSFVEVDEDAQVRILRVQSIFVTFTVTTLPFQPSAGKSLLLAAAAPAAAGVAPPAVYQTLN